MKKNLAFKRVLSFAVVVLMLMSMMSVVSISAAEKTTKDGFVYEVSGNKVTITGYTGDAESITIPEKIDGKSVVAIGDYAFEYNTTIESVSIPKSVESIGDGAFWGCESLDKITVDKNNTVYDSRDNCNAIIETATNTLIAGCNKTVIPEDIEHIGYGVFAYLQGLESVSIPEGVKSIGKGAFYDCVSLESITIPDSVESIGVYAFAYCESLESVTIPEGVESIGDGTFFGCESLESVTFSEGLEQIGVSAFYGCESLKSVKIPASVEVIVSGAFGGSEDVDTIVVDDNNAYYDSRENCNAIIETATNTLIFGCDNTVIPDGVECIARGAFWGCEFLESIVIPASVTCIEEYAFVGCENLTDIYYCGTKEQWEDIMAEYPKDTSFDELDDVTVHYEWTNENDASADADGKSEDTKTYGKADKKDDGDNDLIIFACIVGGAVLLVGVGICLTIILVSKKKAKALKNAPAQAYPTQNVEPVQSDIPVQYTQPVAPAPTEQTPVQNAQPVAPVEPTAPVQQDNPNT